MGYGPLPLDEIPEEQLHAELKQRKEARDEGLCDYCYRDPRKTTPCKFPTRHVFHDPCLRHDIRECCPGCGSGGQCLDCCDCDSAKEIRAGRES